MLALQVISTSRCQNQNKGNIPVWPWRYQHFNQSSMTLSDLRLLRRKLLRVPIQHSDVLMRVEERVSEVGAYPENPLGGRWQQTEFQPVLSPTHKKLFSIPTWTTWKHKHTANYQPTRNNREPNKKKSWYGKQVPHLHPPDWERNN